MSWRVAKSLTQLFAQINAKWPARSVVSDGSIGDAAHSSRTSDHNPNEAGVVCARDFTHDPAHGLDARKLAEALIASRDPRIKYIISNGEICSGIGGTKPWVWRPYTGANAHRKHMHISVRSPAGLYDDQTPWKLDGPAVGPAVGSTLWLQQQLNKHGAKLAEDGKDGPKTDAAIRAYAVKQLAG
jgi:hypothetical protein